VECPQIDILRGLKAIPPIGDTPKTRRSDNGTRAGA
jgi:hypothetical protein